MMLFTDWSANRPPAPQALAESMAVTGSLTAHLMASGHDFAVKVLQQALMPSHADEAPLFELTAESQLHARHVCLTLDSQAVVFARSVCLPQCPVWQPVLDRGSRSLGLTLFGSLPQLQRGILEFATIEPAHPLYQLARSHDSTDRPYYLARRCLFTLEGRHLLVCEVFLPKLEFLL